MDETDIMEGYRINRLVVGRSEKSITLLKVNEERNWTTLFECINPEGRSLKPLVIFQGKSLQQQWFPDNGLSQFEDWLFTFSENG